MKGFDNNFDADIFEDIIGTNINQNVEDTW